VIIAVFFSLSVHAVIDYRVNLLWYRCKSQLHSFVFGYLYLYWLARCKL